MCGRCDVERCVVAVSLSSRRAFITRPCSPMMAFSPRNVVGTFYLFALAVLVGLCLPSLVVGAARSSKRGSSLADLAKRAQEHALWPMAPWQRNKITRQTSAYGDGKDLRRALGLHGAKSELNARTLSGNGTDPPSECPPCFNCLLSKFECLQFGSCSPFDGHCVCPPGYGGDDCSVPSW